MASKGQAALEYLVVIGFALLLSLPLIIKMQSSSANVQHAYKSSMAKNALNNIEEAASLVNSQGEPAKVTFKIQLPDGITQTNVTDNYIHIRREVQSRPADFINPLDFNVSGSIPNSSGVHEMVAEAWNNQVNVSEK